MSAVRRHLARLGLPTLVLVVLVVPLTGLQLLSAAPAGAATSLVGTFTITPGSCSGGAISGTYLRMVLSGGSNSAGPFFSNSDSSCSDNTYTPLSPGSAGGLVTGSYQAEPSPAFDGSGNALADAITAPVAFEGVRFATATNPVDPQTGLRVPAPSVTLAGSTLSGNLQAFGVSWNKQEFNQGSPKPDGSSPGNTTPVTGTYSASSGTYVLQWSSQVVGGPFNGFSAFWNLTGRFVSAGGGAAPAAAGFPSSPTSSGPAAPAPGGIGAASTPSSNPRATGNGSSKASTSDATTTTSPGHGPPSAAPNATRIVLSSRTVVAGEGGWRAPDWLVVLSAVIAIAGVAGILLSERALRRWRAVAE